MAAKTKDQEITKLRVTMTNVVATNQSDKDGNPILATHTAKDYVRPDILEAYVADAQTRWQSVVVSDEPDAGPGGFDGQTAVPARLKHELAGQIFAAAEEK